MGTYTVEERRTELGGTLDYDPSLEEIVDIRRHMSTRIITVLTPGNDGICGYVKDDGKKCQITVANPNDRCHHHE